MGGRIPKNGKSFFFFLGFMGFWGFLLIIGVFCKFLQKKKKKTGSENANVPSYSPTGLQRPTASHNVLQEKTTYLYNNQ